jgi:RNA polymerase sigma factor (sigma-70 family)
MATVPMGETIRHLRRAVLRQNGAARTDGQLLGSFIDDKDEAAFEALVRRCGPMVFGVCRRVVGNHHDAEDAFQATFLVLARKAASVRPRERVANWLHGVALRTAMKAKTRTAKRWSREKQVTEMPEPEATQQDPWRDVQALLDQELNGLPENYRLPILLCDLAGKTLKDAAQQLGWPQGSLAGRLARGRKLLAKRLASRGAVLSAGSLATVVSQNAASACLPTGLMSSTVKAAVMIAAGQATVAGVVPAKVAALVEGVVTSMMLTKLKSVTAVVFLIGTIGIGVAASRCDSHTAPFGQKQAQPEEKGEADQEPRTGKNGIRNPGGSDKELLEGVWRVISLRFDGKEVPKEQMEHALVKLVFFREMVTVYNASGVKANGDYKINPDAKPKSMDVSTPDGTIERLIYKLERDTLTIGEGDDNRPEDFTSKAVSVAVLKRVTEAETKHAAARTDLDRLQGVWSVVSIVQGGKPAPLEKAVFMVDGKRACWQTSESEMQGGLYLDPTGKPKTYDFAMSTRTMEGIYSLDGDTLQLCHDIGADAKRPVGFAAEKDSRQVLFVLKRIHGPEVFPYRLADGTRAFPPVVERVKKATPRPQAAPTLKHDSR